MSGIYNHTYFDNHPEEKDREGVMYGIVLVNKRTFSSFLNAQKCIEYYIEQIKRKY